jgi:uncharacterized protein YdbL (DUF1318 family)
VSTLNAEIEALIAKFEPRLRDAFLAAMRDIAANADVTAVAEALRRRDIEGALAALHIDPAAFAPLIEAERQAFAAAGQLAVDRLPALSAPDGRRVVVRFDMRSPWAEQWLQTASSQMVTAIVEDQRTAVRETLMAGQAEGLNPRTVALDIVGRINPATKQREGGILALTAAQAGYVRNASAELLSGDPERMRRYLGRQRRDRRFDRTVEKAIREGRPVDRATVTKITERYSAKLLALRGETIARTEMMAALNSAREASYRQIIASGAASASEVTKVWRSAGDDRVRHSHREINGDIVGLDERFKNGLLYPHERGAPAWEVVMCRCRLDYRIDYFAKLVPKPVTPQP